MNKKEKCGKRLTWAVQKKYGNKTGYQSEFRRDLETMGYPVSKVSISNYCRGKQEFSNEFAEVAAKILNVRPGYLLGFEKYATKEEEEKLKPIDDRFIEHSKHQEQICLLIKDFVETIDEYDVSITFIFRNDSSIIVPLVYKNSEYRISTEIEGLDISSEKTYIEVTWDEFYGLFIKPEPIMSILDDEDNKIKLTLRNVAIQTEFNDEATVLSINDFLKMIFDIEDAKKRIVTDRIAYWANYGNYNYFYDVNLIKLRKGRPKEEKEIKEIRDYLKKTVR